MARIPVSGRGTWRLLAMLPVLLALPGGATAAPSRSSPPAVYVDKGTCPFECCQYGAWKARHDTTLYEAPSGTRVVGSVRRGEPVEALTGEVHTLPRKLVVVRNAPYGPFRRGETVYVLTYLGEGYWKVWRNGRVLEAAIEFLPTPFADQDPALRSETSYPTCTRPSGACWGRVDGPARSTWWIRIKTASGQIGWTNAGEHFEGKDACG